MHNPQHKCLSGLIDRRVDVERVVYHSVVCLALQISRIPALIHPVNRYPCIRPRLVSSWLSPDQCLLCQPADRTRWQVEPQVPCLALWSGSSRPGHGVAQQLKKLWMPDWWMKNCNSVLASMRISFCRIYKDLCARSGYQGQRQVIISYKSCGLWLIFPALDACFWQILPHICYPGNAQLMHWCWLHTVYPRDPIYLHQLTSIPAWISNYSHHKEWYEVVYPFPNSRGCRHRWSLGIDK